MYAIAPVENLAVHELARSPAFRNGLRKEGHPDGGPGTSMPPPCAPAATVLASAPTACGFPGMRRPIVLALLLKLALLGLLYQLFFSPSPQPRIDGPAVARHFDTHRPTTP